MNTNASISDKTLDALWAHILKIDKGFTIKKRGPAAEKSAEIVLLLVDDNIVHNEQNSFQRVAALAQQLRGVGIACHLKADTDHPRSTELALKMDQPDFEDKLKKFLGIEQAHSGTDQIIARHVANIRQMTRDTILANSERQPVDTEFSAKVYAQTIEGLRADARIMGIENSLNALLPKGTSRSGR